MLKKCHIPAVISRHEPVRQKARLSLRAQAIKASVKPYRLSVTLGVWTDDIQNLIKSILEEKNYAGR